MRLPSRACAIATSCALLLLSPLTIPCEAGELSAGNMFPAERIKSATVIVWYGDNETMTAKEFAAYCAPILWFSPDEPMLREHTGKDITIPEPFPFEDDPGRSVVYFRIRRVIERSDEEGPGFEYAGGDKGNAVIHMRRVVGVDLDFFFYYPEEEGLNAHQHDVESVEMKVAIIRGDTEETKHAMAVTRTKGKAHGVLWYDNTLDSDKYTQFPMHILVEEAKHASCPDKNGDGLYTPGYDVNTRINDAWGVRDIIRGGTLFSASWQAWMAKMRFDKTRVFPPLPEDSRWRERHTRDGVYAPDNAIYMLRPFPTDEKASEDLKHFISGKGYPDWPEVEEVGSLKSFGKWVSDESWAKSFSLALRMDGNLGISFMFPFFIVRNFEDPIGGGYILHRIYLTGEGLDDFGYTAVYTPSASRWIDPYFAIGFENRSFEQPDGSFHSRNDFQFETGIKFRVNVEHTPLKLARKLGTDFWGFRFGVRYFGAMTIEELGYVVEIGAGSF